MTPTLTPLRLDTHTVAVVGARHLAWQRVQLPAGVLAPASAADPMPPRLRSVLEGLLEDRLLDEPHTLHLAVQPPPYPTDGVWIAVCDRAALTQALAELAAQGHVVHRLVPECAPALHDDGPLWITGSPDAPRALWADARGVHQWPLPAGAQHASSWPQPVQERLAQYPSVAAEPALAAWAERALGTGVQVVPLHERLQAAAQSHAWNLAQGSLSLHKPWSLRLQHALATLLRAPEWRPARVAAALLVLVQLVGLQAAAWQARREEAALQAAIDRTLTATFPNIQVVVDAPLQMQRAVDALRLGSGAPSVQDLDVMLQLLEQNRPPAPVKPTPSAIEFEAGSLRLGGLDLPEPQAQALAQTLRSHGLLLRRDGAQWLLAPTGGTP